MGKQVCLRCGYEWYSIKENPKVCPRCKRYDWALQKPEKNEVKGDGHAYQ